MGSQAVIVNDILDTGSTLVSACEKLSTAGVDEINGMVTHGLFTGTRSKDLCRFGRSGSSARIRFHLPLGVDGDGIVRLSIIPLLAKKLFAIDKK